MAEEFTIKSQQIEDKINQLLPSQGGFAPGVDFSASTMVIPIVDLTETAEGSNIRQDLQVALSHDKATTFSVNNTATTVINTTGYYRIIGTANVNNDGTGPGEGRISISDGTTTKIVYGIKNVTTLNDNLPTVSFDFNVFLSAGDSLIVESTNGDSNVLGSVRPIADINGNLINP